jgi:hypothetical protein
MSIRSLAASILFSVSLLAGFAGCAAPPGESEEEESAGADAEPGAAPQYHRVGTTGTSYTCSGGICTCFGDDDCNEMFSGGACSGGAMCHDNGTTVYCQCQGGGGGEQP